MDLIISAALGFVASELHGKNKAIPAWANFLIAMVACTLSGLVITYLKMQGNFNFDRLLEYAGTAFLASQTYYQIFFKNN